MCVDPISMIGMGLSIAGSVAKAQGEAAATARYNAQAAQNNVNANLGAQQKYNDLQRKYSYDATANQKEGYDVALKTRSVQATGLASSADAGIAGSSISLRDLVSEAGQKGAEGLSRVDLKKNDLDNTFRSAGATAEAEAVNRTAQMPFKEGPNMAALGIGIANDVFKAGAKGNWFSGMGGGGSFSGATPDIAVGDF